MPLPKLSSNIVSRAVRHAVTWHVTFEDGGWCKLTIDDKTVLFASDVISGTSTWGAQEDVREFLTKWTGVDYIANNLFPRHLHTVFMEKETHDGLRKEIITHRRRRELTKDEARDLWDQVTSFNEGLHMSDDMWKFLGGEPWYYLKHGMSGAWQRAYDIYLPALLSTMRELHAT